MKQTETEQTPVGAEQSAPTPAEAAKPANNSMKQRIVTAIFYVVIVYGVVLMKIYVPAWYPQGGVGPITFGALGVDVLFWAVSVLGAYEFLRAVKDVSHGQWWATMITCALIIPAFVVTKMTFIGFGSGFSSEASLLMLLSVSSVGMMVVGSLMVFDYEHSNLKSTALAELCILYCGVLACVGPNINHLGQNSPISNTAILLLFILVPCVDVCAFTFGILLGKKLPRKLAPHTSPNKTVVGAVGGVLGGVLAAVLCWLITEYLPGAEFAYEGSMHKLAVLILISLPTSIFAQLGDLFESAVKRSCGVKDMGKILPGHGGMLDRFDSMLFASVSVVVCFILI